MKQTDAEGGGERWCGTLISTSSDHASLLVIGVYNVHVRMFAAADRGVGWQCVESCSMVKIRMVVDQFGHREDGLF